ncbi:MAG: pilus assembly PilX N-terminal domain-containing protein [Candidatus Zixiibacteriota bacterium]
MSIHDEKGSALLITLSLLFMLSILGILALNNSNTEVDLSYNQSHVDGAFYIADAGAKHALCKILAVPGWDSGFTDVSFGDGMYSVFVVDSSTNAALYDTILLVSIGNIGASEVTVEYTLAPDVSHPFKYAMFGKNIVDIRNSMSTDSYNSDSGSYWTTRLTTDGDVGSNGNIIVKNGAFVGGDVATSLTGGLSVNPGATVTETVTDAAPEQDVPDIPQSEFDAAAATNNNLTGISGSYTYDPATYSLTSSGNIELGDGVYYFSDITLMNSASLTIAPGADVTIYVTGDIELKNSAEMNSGGDASDLIIYSQGDFVLKNSGDIAAIFYSPSGEADLRNSGAYSGSIVAYDIIAHNSFDFHYDRNLGKITREGDGDLNQVAFREIR